jgi:ribosomal-protein-alanine N-acetyltransferase
VGQLVIKSMGLRHLPEVTTIEEEAFSNPWSITAFIKEIYNSYATYWVGLQDEELVGYLGFWLLSEAVHLTNLAVKKECRGQGIATDLLTKLYSEAEEYDVSRVSLEVRISNGAARRLYIKEGFVEVEVKENYYKDNGEDAVVMWKQL